MKKAELKLLKRRMLRGVQKKLSEDIDAYIRDYEALICFTLANGGYLAIGVEAFMSDGSSAYDALQEEIHPKEEGPGHSPPADQEGAETNEAPQPEEPLIQLVKR